MDGKTMMEVGLDAVYGAKFDEVTTCKLEDLIVPELKTFTPDEIKRLRESAKLSCRGWAKALNVDVTTVQAWEDGEAYPEGAALKLLNLVQIHGIGPLIQHYPPTSKKRRKSNRKNGQLDKV